MEKTPSPSARIRSLARIFVAPTFLAFLAFMALGAPVSVQGNALKDHLSVFFDMEATDSVVALEQLSPTLLKITVADPATGQTRGLKEEIGAKPMQRLLTESNDLGLKTLHYSAGDDADALPAAPADKGTARNDSVVKPQPPGVIKIAPAQENPAAAEPPSKPPRSLASQRKNRMWYIGSQTLISTYVYGLSVPLAFDFKETKTKVATPMIVAPFAFGTHFWFAKNRPFEDAHAKGTGYLGIAALYAAHAIPFTAMSWDDDTPWRVAAMTTLFAYPLGVYGGYRLGDAYVDQPGRVDIQQKFALGFGLLGFFSPFVYFPEVNQRHQEAIIRLGLGQSVALAAAGHFLANEYRSGQNIPDGVNTGIMDHTALGAAAGLEVAALFDASSVRPWFGTALLGGTLGFMEGLFYYRNSYDSKERGLYNSLGGLAGILVGGGISVLAFDGHNSDYALKSGITSLLVGGAWVGYWATNALTMGMEDRGASGPSNWTDRLAINPIPMPEPVSVDRKVELRLRVPGVTYTF